MQMESVSTTNAAEKDRHNEEVRSLFFQLDSIFHGRVNFLLLAESIFFAASAAVWNEPILVVVLACVGLICCWMFTLTNLRLYWRIAFLIQEFKKSPIGERAVTLSEMDATRWSSLTRWMIRVLIQDLPPAWLDSGSLFTWGLCWLFSIAWAAILLLVSLREGIVTGDVLGSGLIFGFVLGLSSSLAAAVCAVSWRRFSLWRSAKRFVGEWEGWKIVEGVPHPLDIGESVTISQKYSRLGGRSGVLQYDETHGSAGTDKKRHLKGPIVVDATLPQRGTASLRYVNEVEFDTRHFFLNSDDEILVTPVDFKIYAKYVLVRKESGLSITWHEQRASSA